MAANAAAEALAEKIVAHELEEDLDVMRKGKLGNQEAYRRPFGHQEEIPHGYL